ncbi:hypothetical protein K493DRAFT_336046 [Basidiobolus meristosporus CBS 931.73]|uniref:Uncharacterized protein n=1 Tax=Basidiobolus meristosporus CBS 931.73 TaxID=1314790 RepID=A0A1Y1YLQ7_9FUNG|nr:hypothetical protein K493DRAFT_336046 [Basidiobolus meristosporus CBS 931.73]|eukprot:ORX98696.1 hypothetical protein K493DRAFT_336046 [Basidiobolus meristosporus CBS 931.73]
MFKNLDGPQPTPHVHTDIAEVEKTMRDMDSRYNTQFYSWIRNEQNLDYIAYYLQRLINELSDSYSESIPSAIRWLVNGWPIQQIAELLIKLFYHWGVGHTKFASLVSEVTKDWPILNIVQLTTTLVIGERANKTARFVKFLTNHWEPKAIVEVFKHLCLRLRWSERYMKHFLIQYLTLCEEEHTHQRMTVGLVRSRFESMSLVHHLRAMTTEGSGGMLSMVEFSTELFEIIVWEMYELRYLEKWNVICPKEKPLLDENCHLNIPDVPAGCASNSLRIVTDSDQFMDLRTQCIFDKLLSPQTPVHTDLFFNPV